MHPNALLDCCTELLKQVLKFDHPADMVVSRYFREMRLGPRERATVAETIYGVLRKKNLYVYLAQHGSGVPERRLAILGFAAPRDFLYGALTDQEQDWLSRCDQVMPSDLMELHRHNLPQWLVEPLKAQLGDDFWPLVESLNAPAGLDLRVNTLKDKRAEVQKELSKVGIKTVATPYSPWGLRLADKPQLANVDAFKRGAIEVQDEGSQLLALLVDAKRGEMVVDFCAGAGGKTLALGASMRTTGRLYAFDTSAHRLAALKPRLARSGLSNVHPVAIAHERDDRIKRLAGKIDRVLVDAPCSGTGTLRRHPDLKWRQSPATLAELAELQRKVLDAAARLVKPGGRLVYATCSPLVAEDEAVATEFDAAHGSSFERVPALEALTKAQVAAPETLVEGNDLRLWTHRHGTDGFFASIWQRR